MFRHLVFDFNGVNGFFMEAVHMEKREAIKIIRNHVEAATTCMVTVDILNWSLKKEPVENQWIDEVGTIWFSGFSLEDVPPVFVDGNMEVFYSNAQRSQFISIVGLASPATETEQNATRPGNLKHSDLHIVKFIPHSACYWDNDAQNMRSVQLDDSVRARLCA